MRVQHRAVHKSRRDVFFLNVTPSSGRWILGFIPSSHASLISEREVKFSMISVLLTILRQRPKALNIYLILNARTPDVKYG
jgi:hypothetical protein